MKDPISSRRIQLLHPKARKIFQAFVEDVENTLDITIRVAQGLRTFDEQAVIYAQGRTTPGKIVTNAKPGTSYHQYGLAIDIVPLIDGKPNWKYDYKKIAALAPKYNLTWGGNFKIIVDKPHFELTFGYTYKDLLKKYINKEFIQGTKYLNI